MYIVKNALRNIVRSKGRNILIGLIVLVIATASCLALSIRQAAATARETGMESLEITAQIALDRQSMMRDTQKGGGDFREMFQNMEGLTLEEMQTYAQSSHVKDFLYILTASMDGSDTLEPVETETSGLQESSGDQLPNDIPGKGNGVRAGMPGMGNQGDFTLMGCSGYDAMTDFVSGTCQITEGSVFDEDTADAVCVISDELATWNGLGVGDSLTLTNPNDDAETVTLTVVGLYHNSESGAAGGGFMQGFSAASDPANRIYLSYNSLAAVVEASEAGAVTETDEETGIISTTALRRQVSGTYTFADVAGYEAFQADVQSMGLPEGYSVISSDVSQYEQSLVPLENLSKFASVFLLVVLGIGGVILVVFLIFNIRERKYEIGVLTAIGMNKGKVALQFITELFAVTFAFLLLGTVVGAAVSVPATNALLTSQIASQQAQRDSRNQNFGFSGDMGGFQTEAPPDIADAQGNRKSSMNFGGFGQQMTDYLSEVSSATDLTVVLQLLGIGLLLTLLSSGVAVAFVMRYEPLKILSERS